MVGGGQQKLGCSGAFSAVAEWLMRYVLVVIATE